MRSFSPEALEYNQTLEVGCVLASFRLLTELSY